MSARNRELLGLIPVAGLLIAGFAAVFVVRKDEVADASLIFGAYFFAICLAAHVFLRIRLPNADPYLFPLVALLAAIGLVMLYRIDEGLDDRVPRRDAPAADAIRPPAKTRSPALERLPARARIHLHERGSRRRSHGRSRSRAARAAVPCVSARRRT